MEIKMAELRKQKRTKGIWRLCVLCAVLVSLLSAGNRSVTAASASISIEMGDGTIRVGDIVTVDLVLTGTERLGGFEAYLTYHSSVLEFIPADGCIAGGEGLLKISDPEPIERAKSRTYTMRFTAKSVGGCEIAVKDKAYVYADDGDAEMSVSSNSLSIRVEPSASASGNANLASLKISPGTLDPEFLPEITDYRVSVGTDVEKLIISALPEGSGAAVEVEGNEALRNGENEIVITVTAENTDTREYRLTVSKGRESGGPDGEGEPEGPEETEFLLKETDQGLLFTGGYSYLVTEGPASAFSGLGEAYEPFTLVLYGKKVPAYRKAGEEEPKKVLLYAAAGDGEAGIYEFEIETRSMERILIRTVEKEVEVVRTEKAEAPAALYAALVVLAVLCALLAIGMIRLVRKRIR